MRKSVVSAILLVLLGSAAALNCTLAAAPDNQSFLSRARQAYYSLRGQGLQGFKCNLQPNWELQLQDERKQDPAGADAGLAVLNQLRFTVNVGPDGHASVTHNNPPASSAQMAAGFQDIYSGVEHMIGGFFDTWSTFMLDPPLPERGTDFQLEALGPQYRLSYKEGDAHVVTTLAGDFAVIHVDVTTPGFSSSIWPSFTRSPQGFVLAGYDAQYQSGKPDEATQLRVIIGYQQAGGMKLVHDLKISGSYGTEPIKSEVAFTNCSVTKAH